MEKGTTWIYAGSVAWQEQGSQIHQTQVSWTTEILDSVERGRFRIALLLGYPKDLTWYEKGKKRGCYLLTAVDGREFYLRRLDSECALPKNSLSELAIREDLFFRLPVRKGDSFGGDPQREKELHDRLYAWSVEDRKPVTLGGVKGVPQDREFTEYVLAYRTNPDHEITTYVPGIGLTRYIYSHHGTVSEVDVRLVEFHGKARRD